MPVRLVPVSSGKTIKLDKPVLLVGRNPECDVILKQSRKVSRTHCLIACVNNTIVVRDLGSTNGVWLNRHRVDRETRLRIGDELSVADIRYNVVRVTGSNGLKETPDAEIPQKSSQKGDDVEGRSSASVRRSTQPLAPGQEVPVAIPDEEESFLVEASAPRLPRVTPEAIQAAVDESLSEKQAAAAASDSAERNSGDEAPASDSDDVFLLDLAKVQGQGERDRSEQAFEAGLDGTAPPDDSSYDAPIIPLDD